jgi:hydroxyacyl-ACP dehydratase HTD2-like protein with hotdog domain
MSIDRSHIGYALAPFTVTVEPERLALFAQAVGEESQHIAPPTFMKVIEAENGGSQRMLSALGVDLRRVLHAEQQFDYVLPIHAGDQLTVTRVVTDIYEKKGGAMAFIVIQSEFVTQNGLLAGRSRQVILVRNPVAAGGP